MSSIAFWLAARAASFTGPGSPTKLITDRLWSGFDSTSRSMTPGVFLIASAMESMTSFLRPSLKLVTHSTSCNLDASQPSSCQLVSLIVKRAREARSCDRLVSRSLLEKEISTKPSPLDRVPVPVFVILPHLVKGRPVNRKPSKNALFAPLDGPVELVGEEYVCYPVRVFSFVVLEENERSYLSKLLDLEPGFFVDLSRSTMCCVLFEL